MNRAWRPGANRWRVAPVFAGSFDVARRCNTSPLVVQVLHNRRIDTPEGVCAFLNPKLTDLHDPLELPGCQQAARRISQAVSEGERIVIYGDYDVDGMASVAILQSILRLAGADVHYYVPHRLDEGYGLNCQAVKKLLDEGMKLMVTVDCGISSFEPLDLAAGGGAEVIITDHHSPSDRLPGAYSIVHPAVPPGAYANPDLSGAGVAFKLAWQVARELSGQQKVEQGLREFLLEATCLAALGTIADIVPLTGENRCLATFGLRGLPATNHPGLKALLESANLTGERLDAYHVGFLLAPRLNACGRMGHAKLAVELLAGANADRAMKIAQHLAQQNAERQRVEREISEQAEKIIESKGLAGPDDRVIVLAGHDWHGGVIGIVAARLVSRFGLPVILIASNGQQLAQGSGRSIPGFHMRDALAACGEYLDKFGGHAMAGGLRISTDRIADFEQAMRRYAKDHVSDAMLERVVEIDAQGCFDELNYDAVEHLSRLAPFGQGNPEPVIGFFDCGLVSAKRMGKNGGTVCLTLRQKGIILRAVGFGMGELADELSAERRVDVAALPVLNKFNGRTSVELRLRDVWIAE